jgi:hypothetical protein
VDGTPNPHSNIEKRIDISYIKTHIVKYRIYDEIQCKKDVEKYFNTREPHFEFTFCNIEEGYVWNLNSFL